MARVDAVFNAFSIVSNLVFKCKIIFYSKFGLENESSTSHRWDDFKKRFQFLTLSNTWADIAIIVTTLACVRRQSAHQCFPPKYLAIWHSLPYCVSTYVEIRLIQIPPIKNGNTWKKQTTQYITSRHRTITPPSQPSPSSNTIPWATQPPALPVHRLQQGTGVIMCSTAQPFVRGVLEHNGGGWDLAVKPFRNRSTLVRQALRGPRRTSASAVSIRLFPSLVERLRSVFCEGGWCFWRAKVCWFLWRDVAIRIGRRVGFWDAVISWRRDFKDISGSFL